MSSPNTRPDYKPSNPEQVLTETLAAIASLQHPQPSGFFLRTYAPSERVPATKEQQSRKQRCQLIERTKKTAANNKKRKKENSENDRFCFFLFLFFFVFRYIK
ncbi:hypothetical protein V6Z11_D10G215100 [Gossypium hirsutum]